MVDPDPFFNANYLWTEQAWTILSISERTQIHIKTS